MEKMVKQGCENPSLPCFICVAAFKFRKYFYLWKYYNVYQDEPKYCICAPHSVTFTVY